jgi:SAM-dependent methyltransferase
MDLGCGPANYRSLFEHAGFTYAGVDFVHPDAPILADAQALPFKDNSFEFVWSGEMIQYIPQAYPMIREVFRVLAPGGRFIGTVGFLEAFDGHSYHMYTRLGILSLLAFGGFDTSVMSPDDWWTGLTAICSMGLFPRLPNSISHVLTAPLEFASRVYWRLASLKNPKHTEDERLAKVTAGFTFIAHKPVDIPDTRQQIRPA